MLIRLVAAWILGTVVAWIYKHIRREEAAPSFATTLVMLAVLIAMVTQVIGDNVARAFSLVGALSIVRFRTVVRDTQDTAFVIFAVVLGMAAGAANYWVAGIGLFIVGIAAFLRRPDGATPGSDETYLLRFRFGLGQEVESVFNESIQQVIAQKKMLSVQTAKGGALIDVVYRIILREKDSAIPLMKHLNKVEGIQNVEIEREKQEEI
ncbi:MAG: DUF4956 domain-containing protein [Verrucomicrobiales bacterium]